MPERGASGDGITHLIVLRRHRDHLVGDLLDLTDNPAHSVALEAKATGRADRGDHLTERVVLEGD
ncbi:MAG TPA: hypothetical protein VE093_31275, partial [Polyangiaceae bacterium]|nr:hypothetical protein [Polyangiaceae bacterium]